MKPNFDNLLKVLKCEKPEKPVLFELFLNMTLYQKFAGRQLTENTPLEVLKLKVDGFAGAGYDYATTHGSSMNFNANKHNQQKTRSINDGTITDRESFEKHNWPNPEDYDYSQLEEIKDYLPENMKLMVNGPGGVLENVIDLVGYDNLCIMRYEEEDLFQDMFDAVGSRLVKYYEICAAYDSVGLIMSNDDWGFNTQTFFSTEDMRKYVFPWHKKIVETAKKANKPVVLHSCGYMGDVMEDIINMGYDGKHSFEDNILSIEKSYERWGGRIALLGGIDVDFLIRSSEEDITARCKNMLELASTKNGYALGSGNSIPEYVPVLNYMAMINSIK